MVFSGGGGGQFSGGFLISKPHKLGHLICGMVKRLFEGVEGKGLTIKKILIKQMSNTHYSERNENLSCV